MVTAAYGSGRVPQVRQSVPGPKKTGEAHRTLSASSETVPSLRKKPVGQQAKKHSKKPFSAQVRWGEPGAPVQNHGLRLGANDDWLACGWLSAAAPRAEGR